MLGRNASFNKETDETNLAYLLDKNTLTGRDQLVPLVPIPHSTFLKMIGGCNKYNTRLMQLTLPKK